MIGPINEGYRTVCGNSAYVWALTGQEVISELPFASFSKRDLVRTIRTKMRLICM